MSISTGTCKSEPGPEPELLVTDGAISIQDSESDYAMTSPLDELHYDGGGGDGDCGVDSLNDNADDDAPDALADSTHQPCYKPESPAAAAGPAGSESPSNEAASDPESPVHEHETAESPSNEAASDPESSVHEHETAESPSNEAASDPETPPEHSDNRDNMTLADLQAEAIVERERNIVPVPKPRPAAPAPRPVPALPLDTGPTSVFDLSTIWIGNWGLVLRKDQAVPWRVIDKFWSLKFKSGKVWNASQCLMY